MADINTGQLCNNSCIMCTTVRTEDKKVKQVSIPKNEIFKMLDSVKKNECISITGGEPTIREDLPEIIRFIKKRFPDNELKLLTNGRMLSYLPYCKKMVELGVNTFIIPLHAHNASLHDFIARAKGSFRQAMSGINNLLNFEVHTEIRVVIHGINYPFLPEISELINDEFSNVSVVFLYFDMIGSAHINRKKLVIPIKKVVPYLEKAIDLMDKKNVRAYHFPLCLLNERYRDIAKGRTVEERRIMFIKECDVCKMKEDCCGIWRTYSKMEGTGEFKAIK